ncbi:hypothetical protein [Bradyrhizobium sp. CCBAU 11386]|uniref:hypothetical protein n=1 Tax=Bradyrhizobium sp. CCBAU 11386 TaxID=1630837 RepID=UPI002FE11AAC
MEPIRIDGRSLATLREAGEYIAGLPKKEHNAPEWRAAMEALLLVAERNGPTMLARIGHAGAEPTLRPGAQSQGQGTALARWPASD